MSSDRDERREGRRLLAWELLGGGLVIGLFVTVAGPFIVGWITQGVEERGLEGFWGPILGVLVTALAVVSVLVLMTVSIIRPTGRERWGRFGRWLWSLRPVSTRRYTRDLAAADKTTTNLAAGTNAAVAIVREQVEAVTLEIAEKVGRHTHAIEDLDKEVRKLKPRSASTIDVEANKRAGRGELAVTAPAPVVPAPRPRWNVGPENTDDPDLYVIQNMVPRSVALEVRVEADQDMEIIDAGHWQDLSVEGPRQGNGTFIGVANARGIEHGVNIEVSWYDETGSRDSVQKTVWPKKPDGFAVATITSPNDETPF